MKTSKTSSENSYSNKTKSIESNIKLLQERLIKHNDKFKGQSWNWGYVGDIEYVDDKLKELLFFFK